MNRASFRPDKKQDQAIGELVVVGYVLHVLDERCSALCEGMDCLLSEFDFRVAEARVYNRSMGVVGLIAILAAVVTVLVNRVPDPGAQVTLFIVFGLLFGLPWALREIKAVLGGLIVGVLLGILVVVIDGTTGSMTGPEATLVASFKWLVPFFTLTAMASAPLLSGQG